MASRMPKRTTPHERKAILCTTENTYQHSRRRRLIRRNANNVLNLGVRWPESIAVNWFCCFCRTHSLLCAITFSLLSFFRQCDYRAALTLTHPYRCSVVVIVTKRAFLAASACGLRQCDSPYRTCICWLQRGHVYLNSRTASLLYGWLCNRMDLLGESPARAHTYLTHFHLISEY